MGLALNAVVHNEAHRLPMFLALASEYVDEMVVVVQRSDDDSAAIAARAGANVIHDECHGYSEASRELAASYTRADWILCLDADERVVPEHVADIPLIPGAFVAARFEIATFIDGQFDSAGRHLRLYRKDLVRPDARIHSQLQLVCQETCDNVLAPTDGPWIINDKARWEQDLDDARYLAHPVMKG